MPGFIKPQLATLKAKAPSGGVMTKRARSVVAAATSAEMPGFIKPQLATLKAKAPSGDQWLHEIKFDGYRVQVHLDKGKKRVFTRNGLDWTKRFSVIAGALDIPGQAILDGEVVVIMRAAPISPSYRPNLPRAGRTGWSTTCSTCSGGTATSANFLS
jgi:ATP-dependent DNA ligase